MGFSWLRSPFFFLFGLISSLRVWFSSSFRLSLSRVFFAGLPFSHYHSLREIFSAFFPPYLSGCSRLFFIVSTKCSDFSHTVISDNDLLFELDFRQNFSGFLIRSGAGQKVFQCQKGVTSLFCVRMVFNGSVDYTRICVIPPFFP